MNRFIQKLEKRWNKKLYVCVGLDSDYSKIPDFLKKGKNKEKVIFNFNKAIIDKTADLVCSYKMQSSYYEAQGSKGMDALLKTVKYLQKKYPEIPTILDAKRADIGSTNLGYITSAFELMGFDAITVNPYLGAEALKPFLERKDKGIIILVKTSNLGSGEFQNLLIDGKPLYKIVARNIAKDWNKLGNCSVVVGATYPEELKDVRRIIGDMPILIPGIGAQGGDLESTIKMGRGKNSWAMIIHSARGIIFASDNKNFARVAREATINLHQDIVSLI